MAAAGGARHDVMDMEADRAKAVVARVLVSVVDVAQDGVRDVFGVALWFEGERATLRATGRERAGRPALEPEAELTHATPSLFAAPFR